MTDAERAADCAAALADRCRECGAWPGSPCRGAYGPVPWYHAPRGTWPKDAR